MNASIIAFRAGLEFSNVVTAVVMLWNVRMPLPPKIHIIAAFSMRFLSANVQSSSLE